MAHYSSPLDRGFGALADPIRRGVLERLERGDASISELAEEFDLTLTGIRKQVGVLESAGLVTTRKLGRVRICRAAPLPLGGESAWIGRYQRSLDARRAKHAELNDRSA